MVTWWLPLIATAAPPSVDAPLRTGAQAAADAAVVIGVEDYAFVDDVPYARRDAEAVATWLVYSRGVPQQHVETLLDASREQVLAAVDRAAERVGTGGTVWVYWAGHGAASPDNGERLLLGVDVMPEAEVFASRGVSVIDLQERLGSVDSILWLDTCYTGAARGSGSLLSGTRLAVPSWALEPTGRAAVWTATKGRQVSAGYDAARHGLFTYVSLGALRGWADGELSGEPDGQVSAEEAHAYTRRRVAELGGHTQTPRWLGPMDHVLATEAPERAPAPTPLQVQMIGALGDSGTVEDVVLADPGVEASLGLGAPEDRDRKQQRARELRKQTQALDREARSAFSAIEEDARSGRAVSEGVLTDYLQSWSEPTVAVDGEQVVVELPTVQTAEGLLQTYPERHRARAAQVRMGIGGVILGGAAASYLVSTSTRTAYESQPLDGQSYQGLYNANRVAVGTTVGLAVLGSGFVVSGVFR